MIQRPFDACLGCNMFKSCRVHHARTMNYAVFFRSAWNIAVASVAVMHDAAFDTFSAIKTLDSSK
jgi:hypothetical protein